MRLLIVEDDEPLRDVLARAVTENGYVADAVADGEAALAYLKTYAYEVVLLDWRMPRMNGVEVLGAIRSMGLPVPVLMLTARDDLAARVEGLDAGADDYLVKPFDVDELLARLRALQRRRVAAKDPVIRVGSLTFDPASRRARIGGVPIGTTAMETAILELLMRRAPAVVSRSTIALNVWSTEADGVGSNTIDVHVARLRAKIAGARVEVETMRGVGYRLRAR